MNGGGSGGGSGISDPQSLAEGGYSLTNRVSLGLHNFSVTFENKENPFLYATNV